jgi:Spy/CpxP family protein refolding chaperone
MERSARTRIFTAAVLAVVFGAGTLLGVALSRSLGANPPDPVATAAADSSARPRRMPMYMKVDPTEEQRVKMDSIVKQSHEAMRALTKEFHQQYDPRYEALITQTRAAIRAVLTPEQVVKYDSLVVESDRRHAEQRSNERGSRDSRE